MTTNPQYSNVGQPLTLGNVISTGISLYRDRFREYVQVAAIATGWLCLPFVIALFVGIFFAAVQNYYAVLGIIAPALLILLIYVSAKYLACSALISRRCAMTLMGNTDESFRNAQRYVNERMWGLWLAQFFVGLIFGGMLIAFYLIMAVLVGIFIVAMGGPSFFESGNFESDPNIALIFLGIAIAFFLILLFLVLLMWLGGRLAFPEVALAVEPEVASVQSIGRCWKLTERYAWRTFLILFITGLLTFPVQIVVQILSTITQLILALTISTDSPIYIASVYIVSYGLGFVAGIFLLPLWQSMKAVIYYDLRIRREGFGLQLRDASNEPRDSF
jgi:hypothetical protein